MEDANDILTRKKTEKYTIYVAKHGWHTSVVMQKSYLDSLVPSITGSFPDARYLDISWGDEQYFMAPEGTIFLALRAALIPTQSVIRVMGYSQKLDRYLDQEHFLEVTMNKQELNNLTMFINNTLSKNEKGEPIPVGINPSYYLSDIQYWGLRTCNTWTARSLKRGGVSIHPLFSQTAGSVMKRIEKLNSD